MTLQSCAYVSDLIPPFSAYFDVRGFAEVASARSEAAIISSIFQCTQDSDAECKCRKSAKAKIPKPKLSWNRPYFGPSEHCKAGRPNATTFP